MCQPLVIKKTTNSLQESCNLLDNVQEKLSELVSRRLRETGMSKAELSRRVGVTRTYIGNMANGTAPTKSGEYHPGTETVEKLSKHLVVSQNEILTAIGYSADNKISESDLDDTLMRTIYHKFNKITPAKRAELRKILEMVDRELDGMGIPNE